MLTQNLHTQNWWESRHQTAWNSSLKVHLGTSTENGRVYELWQYHLSTTKKAQAKYIKNLLKVPGATQAVRPRCVNIPDKLPEAPQWLSPGAFVSSEWSQEAEKLKQVPASGPCWAGDNGRVCEGVQPWPDAMVIWAALTPSWFPLEDV